MKYRVIAVLAVVACFAMFFQNCGMQVRFVSADGKLLAKQVSAEDIEAQLGDGDVGGVIDNAPADSPTPAASATPQVEVTPGIPPESSATPVATSTPETTVPPQASATPDAPGKSGDAKEADEVKEENEEDAVVEAQSLEYVCVLNGPGRSILLGYLDSIVGATKSTPDTICTTERGCLEIAKQKFDVKEAVKRAYCNSNKHVIKATEEQLTELLGNP